MVKFGMKTDRGKLRVEAMIYRHSEGYPSGVQDDLAKFFAQVEHDTDDNRFRHPEYLAAKFLVWAVAVMREHMKLFRIEGEKDGPLNFLSYGVAKRSHCDVSYEYFVDCSSLVDGHPRVLYRGREGKFRRLPAPAEQP